MRILSSFINYLFYSLILLSISCSNKTIIGDNDNESSVEYIQSHANEYSIFFGIKKVNTLLFQHLKKQGVKTNNEILSLDSLTLKYQNSTLAPLNSLAGIENFENLKYLEISNHQISEVSPLKNLNKIEVLNLNDNKIKHIKILNDLENLIDLFVTGNPIEDFATIQLKLNRIKKINPILFENLTNLGIKSDVEIDSLKELNLSHITKEEQKLTSVAGFNFFTKLKELNLNGHLVSDLSTLEKLKNLETLNILNLPLTEFSSILKNRNLKSIKHNHKELEGWGNFNLNSIIEKNYALRMFENGQNPILKIISEKNNNLFNILTSIGIYSDNEIQTRTSLRLRNNKLLNSLAGLEYFTNLESLKVVGYPDISNLEPIKKLVKLKTLWVREASIQSIYDIRELTNLEDFCIRNNTQFNGDLSVFDDIKKIKSLGLHNCNLHNINGLVNLTSLEELYIGGNHIKDISILKENKNLVELYAFGNLVKELGFLYSLEKIKRLCIWNNKIKSLEPITSLKLLEKVWVKNNNISKGHKVKTAKKLKKGLVVDSKTMKNNLPKS